MDWRKFSVQLAYTAPELQLSRARVAMTRAGRVGEQDQLIRELRMCGFRPVVASGKLMELTTGHRRVGVILPQQESSSNHGESMVSRMATAKLRFSHRAEALQEENDVLRAKNNVLRAKNAELRREVHDLQKQIERLRGEE